LELPAHLELTPAWRDIRAELRRTVGDSTYDIWLAPLELRGWDGSVLLLHAPADKQAWVAQRFGRVLERAVRAVFGTPVRVSFAAEDGRAGPRAGATAASHAHAHAPDHDEVPSFNPRHSFDQFVMGDGNRLAHAAALAVAENPGGAYNPLFLYGRPGLGKTHLLHAIGNYLSAFGSGTTVRYTTVEEFTNGFIAALNARSLDRFKRRFRDVDVLLIDDVQFLASKAKTEEEFFHTFNALYDSGRQLVLTCDRVPAHLLAVEDRLRDRFQSGLVAELSPPDHNTRVAILRKRIALDRVRLTDPGVLDLIAHRVTDNIRSLEGALIRVVATHSLTGHPIDLDLARRVLADIAPTTAERTVTVPGIQEVVATYYDVTRDDLLSSKRTANIVWARHVAMQISRDLTHDSLEAIGRAFGGRNHATVLHACKRVSAGVSQNREAASDIEALHSMLAADHAADRDS
jgi:chromosomal replication initiator protein